MQFFSRLPLFRKFFTDDYYLSDYLNNKRSISKKIQKENIFPTLPVIICMPPPRDGERNTSHFVHQYSLPGG